MNELNRHMTTVGLVDNFVDQIPSVEIIRAKLDANAAETRLLKRMLKLAIERDARDSVFLNRTAG